MTSEEGRNAMLGVARNYDSLAEYAERLQNRDPKGTAHTPDEPNDSSPVCPLAETLRRIG
jgi:hypothetical protein